MFVIAAAFMCNNVPFKKSLLYGDVAYQSIKLVKESYNRPKSNWTKTKNGKYLHHGVISIMTQFLGITTALLELFGYGINKTCYFICTLDMCITAIPLMIDTPFHKWIMKSKLEIGSDTIAFQLGFFQMLVAVPIVLLCVSQYLYLVFY